MDISLADALFWLAVATCVVAQAAIIRSVLRMRNATAAAGVPSPRFAIELAWVAIPTIALAAALLLTWHAIHPQSSSAVPPHRHATAVVSADR